MIIQAPGCIDKKKQISKKQISKIDPNMGLKWQNNIKSGPSKPFFISRRMREELVAHHFSILIHFVSSIKALSSHVVNGGPAAHSGCEPRRVIRLFAKS